MFCRQFPVVPLRGARSALLQSWGGSRDLAGLGTGCGVAGQEHQVCWSWCQQQQPQHPGGASVAALGHRQLHPVGLEETVSVSSAFSWRGSPQMIARIYSRGKKLSLLEEKEGFILFAYD